MDGPLAEEIKIRNRTGGWITITNRAHIEHMSETIDLRLADALGVTYCEICANMSNTGDMDAVAILDNRAMLYQFHRWFGTGGCWEGYICPDCEDQLPEDYISIHCKDDEEDDEEDEDLPSCEGAKCICRCQMLDCQAAVTRGTYVVKASSW